MFVFKNEAKKTFDKLPQEVRARIIYKLKSLNFHPNVFAVIKRLKAPGPATHRLRVGSHRLILCLDQTLKDKPRFFVLDVGHRREIYK